MRTRRAKISDAAAIHSLVAHYAAQGLLLPRAAEEIRAISAVSSSRKIVIVSSAAFLWKVTARTSLKSVPSRWIPENRGQGFGARLITSALDEARRRGIARVFAVTHAPEFFERQGFAAAARQSLTEKIERDCRTCPQQRTCKLVAVIATVIPERVSMPILSDSAAPVPAC